MGSTSTYGLPYAELGDAPDGPIQQQALAEAVELELERVDAAAAALEARGESANVVLDNEETINSTVARQLLDLELAIDVPDPSAVYSVSVYLDHDGGGLTGGAGSVSVVELRIDGAGDPGLIVSNATTRNTLGRTWRVAGLTAGVHSLEVWAYRAGSGSVLIRPNSSVLIVERQA